MSDLAAQRIPFVQEVMPRAQAIELFAAMHQDFKVDIIDRLPDDVTAVSIYRTGEFIDLFCHLMSTAPSPPDCQRRPKTDPFAPGEN